MKIKAFYSQYFATAYLYYDENSALLIDAPDTLNIDKAISFSEENNIDIKGVLLTHAHYDHILGLGEVRKRLKNINIYLDKEDFAFIENSGFLNRSLIHERLFKEFEDEFINLPNTSTLTPLNHTIGPFAVLKTPGHTTGSVVFYDKKENVAFTGDTIFKGSIGRTDLGGSYSLLISSLDLIKKLPQETLIYPGHGESTSLKEELKNNPYLS